MLLANGALLGPYRIESPVGEGGMGEIYRAQDTRLGRAVAIKVLPSPLSQDVGFRERFAREARAISSLSHPNICALYDVGNQGGVDFLVMEYLEGETLAARLKKGVLPIEQALRYGTEVAMALEAAHRCGIIHRDLKPGNVMLTKTGAKLLDFGVATLKGQPFLVPEGKAKEDRLTATGMVIGTLHYMAPEQIEGREADARTDVFALGCVLYEMVAGQPPFTGESTSAVMRAVLASEPPPLEGLRTDAPVALQRLIKTCLAKDPEERWQTAHDVGLQLRGIAEGGPEPKALSKPASSPKKGSAWLAWMFATGALLVALGLGLASGRNYFEKRSVEASPIRFELYPPEKSAFNFAGFAAAPVAVSPDGWMLAFGGRSPEGKAQLWVRPLGSLVAQALPETDGASYPFWSPDSRSVGFFAQGKLKRIEVGGGSPHTLCDAPSARGGTWNQQGVIVFAPDVLGPLYQVSALGGIPTPVTEVSRSGGLTHRWPWFLPDGRHFLYVSGNPRGAAGGDEGLYVGSLDSKEAHRLLSLRSKAVYQNGNLLYVRNRTLVAQPFDAKTLKIAGDPIPLAQSLAYSAATLSAVFSASAGGLLAYSTSAAASGTQLIWYDRQGQRTDTLDESVVYYSPELSPDGKQLAVDVLDPSTGNVDIWLYQLATNLKARLTFGKSVNMSPVWSPDGTQIAFASNRNGVFDLYRKLASSSGGDEVLLQSSTNKNPTDWSPDGRYLLFEQRDPIQKGRSDIGVLPLFGDRTPFVLTVSDAGAREALFHPNGRWIAYTSDETGRDEVYVTSFPHPGSLREISTAGGKNPCWGRDGKELFFLTPDLQMMVAEVNGQGSTFEIGAVHSLFSTHAAVQAMASPFAVSADGKKFLVDSLPEANSSPITIVVNWTAALKGSRPGDGH
jgi:serine/threonine protein kinase/Tol biopolymer transport system component